MYQSDLQNETSKVIIKELKEMFDRIDFHVRKQEIPTSLHGQKKNIWNKVFQKKNFGVMKTIKNEETRS